MKTVYFDTIKDETKSKIKFGDDHTSDFDIWIRKADCQWCRWNHGFLVHVPDDFNMRICLA